VSRGILQNTEIALADSKAFIENTGNYILGMKLYYQECKDGKYGFSYFNNELVKVWKLSADVLKNNIGKVWEEIHNAEVAQSLVPSGQNLSLWGNDHRFILPDGNVK